MENIVPTHIAIILDGNGRWAKKRMLPRKLGHRQGAKNVELICEKAYELGVKYLTVYAFSTENWKRPKDEVTAIMELLNKYLLNYLDKAMKNNMRVRIIGDKSMLSEEIQQNIKKVEDTTKNNSGLNFQIAINYGGRDEITRAIKKIVLDIDNKKIKPEEIDEKLIRSYLDTYDIVDPELIIRTSGECRTSNFLTWQASYSEYYFTDVLWPDFNEKELKKAIENYAKRNRRFGGI